MLILSLLYTIVYQLLRIGKQPTENKFDLLAVINPLMHSGVCWICLLCDNGREAETKELYPGKQGTGNCRQMRTFLLRTSILLPLSHPEQSLGLWEARGSSKTLNNGFLTLFTNPTPPQVNLFPFPSETFLLGQTVVSLAFMQIYPDLALSGNACLSEQGLWYGVSPSFFDFLLKHPNPMHRAVKTWQALTL